MTMYHRKPPIFEIYGVLQDDDAVGVQAWLDAFPPGEFERVFFESVVASPYVYDDGSANYLTGVRVRSWRNGVVYRDLTVFVGEIILWELGESTVFAKFPAAELDKYQPLSEPE